VWGKTLAYGPFRYPQNGEVRRDLVAFRRTE